MHKQSERTDIELKPRFPRLQNMRRKLSAKRRQAWVDWLIDASELDMRGPAPSY